METTVRAFFAVMTFGVVMSIAMLSKCKVSAIAIEPQFTDVLENDLTGWRMPMGACFDSINPHLATNSQTPKSFPVTGKIYRLPGGFSDTWLENGVLLQDPYLAAANRMVADGLSIDTSAICGNTMFQGDTMILIAGEIGLDTVLPVNDTWRITLETEGHDGVWAYPIFTYPNPNVPE